MAELRTLLADITKLWLAQIELCENKKEKDFGASAREIMHYVGKRYRRIGIEPVVDGIPQNPMDKPTWLTVFNLTQAAVDVLTPYVFARIPNRLVSPENRPQIPPELQEAFPNIVEEQSALKKIDTMMCFLLQWWLNYCPKKYNLVREGKMAVREAIAKGRGTCWLEVVDSPIGEIPGSIADSVDNLLIDADCVQMKDAGFIVRKRKMQNWKIADLFGEDVKKVRATEQSAMFLAMHNNPEARQSQDADKGDIGTFYEFWSVMGMGDKLVAAPDSMQDEEGVFKAVFDQVGPYVHFAIMPGIDHPLGMDPEKLEALLGVENGLDQMLATLKAMLEWPIPTYENRDNPWPVFCLDFLPNIDNPWAKSILEAGMPLQRFIDEIYQGLMNRARVVGKDMVLTSAAVEQALNDALVDGVPFEIVKLGDQSVGGAEIDKLVHVLQFPPMNGDIIPILGLCEEVHKKLTGTDDSMFGGIPRTQERSAKASAIRESGLARRPDDYADTVEAWQSALSGGEAVAARLLVDADTFARFAGENVAQSGTVDVGPQYGAFTTYWMTLVHTDDPAIAAAECSYTVESGSGRRRNKQLLQDNAEQLYTMLGQQFYAFGTETKNYTPFLSLVQMVGDAFDMPVQPLIEKFKEALAIEEQKMAQMQQQAMQQAMQQAQMQGQGQGGQGQGQPGMMGQGQGLGPQEMMPPEMPEMPMPPGDTMMPPEAAQFPEGQM